MPQSDSLHAPTGARWQFWMDVGGTFTDVISRSPTGETTRRKVLSAATIKGAGQLFDSLTIFDPARIEVDHFWAGYRCLILVGDKPPIDAGLISSSTSRGELRLQQAIPPELLNAVSDGKLRYEIESPEDSPILAIRLTLQLALAAPIPPLDLRLGTTRGTNALLTRSGARTALLITKGFRDALAIGNQNRPQLFALRPVKQFPLTQTILEIDERLDAEGNVLQKLDEQAARAMIGLLKQQQIESLAICLLHAHKNPVHEQRLQLFAEMAGFQDISVSSAVWPLMKLIPRGDTTVVDAYLGPVIRKYVEQLRSKLPGSQLQLMTSAGGLAESRFFRGKDSLLSGPAGGVIGVERVARAADIGPAIGFDMGGTSTDVCRSTEARKLRTESTIAGVRVNVPHLPIDTIAAGGGSICRFDASRLVVGPESAGAHPGPACYGRGGPLTITDCNLVTGRLLENAFAFPLDKPSALAKLAAIAQQIEQQTAQRMSLEEIAEGFLRIANTKMAAAIRLLARDSDLREFTLVAFGSAAGQHATSVATELGMTRVLVHPDAGVMSALGIGLADVVKHQTSGIYRLFATISTEEMQSILLSLEQQAIEQVVAEGIAREEVETFHSLDLRYQGTDQPLRIESASRGDRSADWPLLFANAHQQTFGYVQERPLEVVAAHVMAIGRSQQALPRSRRATPVAGSSSSQQSVWMGGKQQNVPVFQRFQQQAGMVVQGPALLTEPLTVVVVPEQWQATMLSGGEWLLEATRAPQQLEDRSATAMSESPIDPVLLEVVNLQLAIAAEQMGEALRSTSVSVNVKERLDYSTAIFDARGNLVATAAHIPVHLGAMSETVKQLLLDFPDLAPGDALITNDPYRGGSHLPDVTVVTPIFDASNQFQAFVANRAHHAEIGGITPGSMPAFSKNLAEEGVLLRGQKLIDRGISQFDAIARQLRSGSYPTRALADNLADLRAQVAANRRGEKELQSLAENWSWPVLSRYFMALQDSAAMKVRGALARLPQGTKRFTDHLDDGTPISVAMTIENESIVIDFAGTGAVSSGNLNANRAIVSAAVLYVLRLLVQDDLPLNQGMLAPVTLLIPEGLLSPRATNAPETSPAIVGGNVETSQRIVDVLLGALGIAAASQGTMNNLLFGNSKFGYYETICGGSGATAEGPGADALHTHMTNTRLTDPEVLEHRFPVRLHKLAIRRGSGGQGEHRGGHGVIREIEMLEPLTVSLVTQRRGPYTPYGAAGGMPGALGKNLVIRRDGQAAELPSSVTLELEAGDRLRIETPGGGGWGAPTPD